MEASIKARQIQDIIISSLEFLVKENRLKVYAFGVNRQKEW